MIITIVICDKIMFEAKKLTKIMANVKYSFQFLTGKRKSYIETKISIGKLSIKPSFQMTASEKKVFGNSFNSEKKNTTGMRWWIFAVDNQTHLHYWMVYFFF